MDVWDWIPIRCGVVAESSVVTTGSPITGGFSWNHVKWRGPGAGGWTDDLEL